MVVVIEVRGGTVTEQIASVSAVLDREIRNAAAQCNCLVKDIRAVYLGRKNFAQGDELTYRLEPPATTAELK